MTRASSLALAFALLSLASPDAAARGRLRVEGLLGGAIGVSIPAGDNEYTRFADVTGKFSLRGAAVIFLTDRFALAPTALLDLIPVNNDISTFQPSTLAGVRPAYGRFRFLAGLHLHVNFKIGAFYFGPAFGIDGIAGSETPYALGQNGNPVNRSSAAFTFQPETGVIFFPVRRLYVGFHFAVPVAVSHDLGRGNNALPNVFHAIDVDLLATIGVRL